MHAEKKSASAFQTVASAHYPHENHHPEDYGIESVHFAQPQKEQIPLKLEQ